ncbi:MaoC family dehydratase [Chelativorans sp. Marseille-P2723]|uniref:MaoC family dehydratase n=1 Tax=Chelativorans sp. Marseille-P2723 TaxID=2709133 RepID=UPI00156D9246|nr:MaoC family dehydratase [Chelativorans sp. Marseille-P2723]
MSLDAFLKLGQTMSLGSHTFTAEEIKRFAARYDPQPFHLDEEAAKDSIFGRLCASGWHTCAMWMRYNVLNIDAREDAPWSGPGERPEFGPSPGFKNLKWLKPVYAGDTITFTRTALSHRRLASRPGWRLLTLKGTAINQDGQTVMEFDNAVLMKAV